MSSPSQIESVVRTFLTKERNWTSINAIPSQHTSPHALPLFHGFPDKRVYISPDDQKRYLRATSSFKAEREQLHKQSTSDADANTTSNAADSVTDDQMARTSALARMKALEKQRLALEQYYHAPRGEFVACVPMIPLPSSNADAAPQYVSGDVLEATFDVIRRVKDTFPKMYLEDTTVAEQVLWDRGRESGETQRPPEPPLRLLLAVVDTDSTIGFYFTHDGLVPPRQN